MEAFKSLRILEIAEGVAGPMAGSQLADLGASVVKLEPPHGDRARGWGPLLADGSSAIFAQLNRGKQGVSADLATEAGRAALHRLLPSFHAVIVQLDPADQADCGIAWNTLPAQYSHLVVCEIDDLGPRGPLANLAGSELTVQALSGFTRYVGDLNGEPCRVGTEIAGMAAGMHASHAVLAALHRRNVSGAGQYLRVTALKALLSLKSILLAAQSGDTDAWNGFHLNGPRWPPDTGWHTRDGQITFDFRHGERDAWEAFCRKVGLERLIRDPDYHDWRSTLYIGDRRHAFGGPYREVFARMTCEEATAIVNGCGGISVKFTDYAEVVAHPQTQALQAMIDVPDAPPGARVQVGMPFKLNEHRALEVSTAAPTLGRDNHLLVAPPAALRLPTPPGKPEGDGRRGPLEGIKVLDASQGAVGPWAGSLLGMLGADVVKLESPQGDFIRAVMPEKRGLSTTYISSNFNKRGITLDLKDPQARQRAHRFAAQADMFIENFRPGVAERIGVGYAELSRINPRIVYASASGFGAVGPLAGVAGTDPHMQAFSGACSVNGLPGGLRQRMRWYGHLDVNTALAIVYGLLAGLLDRNHTGKGCYINVTMIEAAWSLQRVRLAEYLGGGNPRPMGSACTYLVPDQSFDTQDRALAVSATSVRQWRALCTVLGQSGLADDPRFADNPARVANRDQLLPLLAAVFRTRPAQHWLDVLRRNGVPCALFTSYDEFRHNVHYIDNGMVRRFDTPRWGKLDCGGIPYDFAATPCTLWPGKLTGECTEEILCGDWPPLGATG